MDNLIIFPNQLFLLNHIPKNVNTFFLIEDKRFFSDFNFHKKKLLLHRASMQAYKEKLEKSSYETHYFSFEQYGNGALKKAFDNLKSKKLVFFEPVDNDIEKRLSSLTKKHKGDISYECTPAFVTDKDWFTDFFSGAKHFSMNSFYIAQRKRLDILLNKDSKPKGGKWSLDTENRKALPENIKVPNIPTFGKNKYIAEAAKYVNNNFKNNPGSTDGFIYPVTRREALKSLNDFFSKRFEKFGPYEDAISMRHRFLFHSVLSSSINTGLLTPDEVYIKALDYSDNNKIPLNSLEGFIRQIIGWREFMRIVYSLKGNVQRKTNFWQFKNKLPIKFYEAATEIEPVDFVINNLMNLSYCHHIERLMILGNFMLLCEINPDDVYHWFMELFIDAYDWVMVTNVYGMSQYADGGLITTKPYISSSKYILRMSDFEKGPWCEIWDGLYWRFIHKHKDFLIKNPRMAVMNMQLKRMSKAKLDRHIKNAEDYLKRLYG